MSVKVTIKSKMSNSSVRRNRNRRAHKRRTHANTQALQESKVEPSIGSYFNMVLPVSVLIFSIVSPFIVEEVGVIKFFIMIVVGLASLTASIIERRTGGDNAVLLDVLTSMIQFAIIVLLVNN